MGTMRVHFQDRRLGSWGSGNLFSSKLKMINLFIHGAISLHNCFMAYVLMSSWLVDFEFLRPLIVFNIQIFKKNGLSARGIFHHNDIPGLSKIIGHPILRLITSPDKITIMMRYQSHFLGEAV